MRQTDPRQVLLATFVNTEINFLIHEMSESFEQMNDNLFRPFDSSFFISVGHLSLSLSLCKHFIFYL